MGQDTVTEPTHPGEHLAEFCNGFDITQYRLAKGTVIRPGPVRHAAGPGV